MQFRCYTIVFDSSNRALPCVRDSISIDYDLCEADFVGDIRDKSNKSMTAVVQHVFSVCVCVCVLRKRQLRLQMSREHMPLVIYHISSVSFRCCLVCRHRWQAIERVCKQSYKQNESLTLTAPLA